MLRAPALAHRAVAAGRPLDIAYGESKESPLREHTGGKIAGASRSKGKARCVAHRVRVPAARQAGRLAGVARNDDSIACGSHSERWITHRGYGGGTVWEPGDPGTGRNRVIRAWGEGPSADHTQTPKPAKRLDGSTPVGEHRAAPARCARVQSMHRPLKFILPGLQTLSKPLLGKTVGLLSGA